MVPKQPSLASASSADADVLRWQHRLRVVIATAVVGGAFLLDYSGVHRSSLGLLAIALGGYGLVSAVVISVAPLVRGRTQTIGALIAISVVADLAFVFAFTAATSAPSYYGRTLVVAFLVVHLAETYFGRAFALLAMAAGLVGYFVLVLRIADLRASWGEPLWSAAIFAASVAVVLGQFGTVQRRLQQIVALFERAEQGDFAKAYDVKSDRHPDIVTRVGAAYNRVRIHLASMVQTDPLTGCLNLRGFDQAMARELSRSARSGTALSLLALDLDHFKNVNDTYGHLAGDAVLRELGGLLVQTARAGDMVARTGGEEFSILLPDTNAEGAYLGADRLCDAVRSHVFHANGRPITLTVSVGVASTDAIDGTDPGSNMKERADQALYAAKRGGRNQVQAWRPELGTELPSSPMTRTDADLLSQ